MHAQVRYYLEDDTVDVTEPKQPNSGLPQVLPVCRRTLLRITPRAQDAYSKGSAEMCSVCRNSALS